MSEASTKVRGSHYVVPAIASLNMVYFALGTWYLPFYRLTERAHISFPIVVWYIVSSFALPMYVIAECILWRKDLARHGRAIVIDAIFGFGWFFILWVSAIYSLLHTVWL